jgi:hypothetical protein
MKSFIISDNIKEDRMGGELSTQGETRNSCKTLVGNPERRDQLGNPGIGSRKMDDV